MPDGRVDAFARHSISGWAADTEQPDAHLEVAVFVDGHEQGRATANAPRADLQALGTLGEGAHGFAYAFDPPLSPMRSYEITVRIADGGQPLRLGRFTIAAEINHAADRIRPIMVTTSGQPGFTELMRSLAGNPHIVAADSHTYGVKLMTYYARALEVLVVPASRSPIDRVGVSNEGDYVLTPNPFHGPEFEDLFRPPRLLYEFFQNRSGAPICAAFKAVVTEFYETLAMQHGKRMAGYFAEQSDLFDVARNFARLAFRDMREIVLLQDPRDAYCGYRALWSTSPAQAMATLRRVRDRVLDLRGENRPDTMFLRCEDLRLRPESTLLELTRFLSPENAIVADPKTVETAAAAANDATALGIGQWRTELDRDELALFDTEFGEYLRLFGYDTAASSET